MDWWYTYIHTNIYTTCPMEPTKQEIPRIRAAGAGSAPGDQGPGRSTAWDPSLTRNILLLSSAALPRSVLTWSYLLLTTERAQCTCIHVCLQRVCLHACMLYNGCCVKCVHRLCVNKCAESLTLLCHKQAGHLPSLGPDWCVRENNWKRQDQACQAYFLHFLCLLLNSDEERRPVTLFWLI